MADEPKQNWLHTLPGILTATGTLLGAVTALLLALNQIGLLGGSSKPVQAEPDVKPEAPAAAAAPGTQPAAMGACAACPEMVTIPAGSFLMGSPKDEAGRGADEGGEFGNPVKVTIARPFAVGRYEVTFNEWEACVAGGGCKSNPTPADNGWGRGKRPVINVSWEDAQEFLTWLNAASASLPGRRYRLLSEAEWEYAARAATATPYPWGREASRRHANYGSDTCCSGAASGEDQWEEGSAPVGQFPANPFGLHDMHGNVWEWVAGCYVGTYPSTPPDGSEWIGDSTMCAQHVARGASWYDDPRLLRSALRNAFDPGTRDNAIGFRVARSM